MHYENDSQGIFNAKEQVRQIELEIEIANKEKQIDLIEKEIDLLENKLDLLDEEENRVNDFYDNLSKQTEDYYNSQIKNLEKHRKEVEAYYSSLTKSLENQKDKFQELTEILEKAELSAKLKQLGIDEEALLNGSEEEFEKLKNAYMNIVTQLNQGNNEVLSALQELSGYDGTAPAMLEDSNSKLDDMNGKLDTSNQSVGTVNDSLADTATKTSDVASNVSDLTTNLGEVNTLVTEEQTAFDTLKQIINEVIEVINQKTQAVQEEQNAVGIATGSEIANFELLKNKILEVKESLDAVNDTVIVTDRQPVDNLANAFQLLYDKVLLVSNLLGVSVEGEGAINGISGAIQALNEISLEEGIIAQFNNLKTAIDQVTAAISGGGGESSEGVSSGGASGSAGGKQGSTGGNDSGDKGKSGGNSLNGAIKEMGDTAKEIIGEPDAEGDGTVIGEFGSMETAVNDVRDAIGGGDSEGGKGQSSSGEGEGNLIGSIVDLGEQTEEVLGEPDGEGAIGRFEKFKKPIQEADEHVKSISKGLDEIDGKEVECTITVNVKQNGSAYAEGTVLGSMNLESGTYKAQYGKAFAEGTGKYTGLPKAEKNALVSEYGQTEMTVLPDGKTIITDEPTMMDLPKDTVIYNEEQTKKIMDNKVDVSGNAHADGTSGEKYEFISLAEYIQKLRERSGNNSRQTNNSQIDPNGKTQEKFENTIADVDHDLKELLTPTHIVAENMERLMRPDTNGGNMGNISNIVNNNRNQPVTVNQNVTLNCPNLTNNSGVEYVQKQLGNLSLRAYQEPLHDY